MMKGKIDPRQSPDWQIAEAHEASMKPAMQLGRELGLNEDELIPHGKWLAKVDHKSAFQRLQSSSRGKHIDVTAITPTPLGEGKTTTAIGLIQGLGRLGHKVSGALRQPSGGPTFNVKGSAAGGGLAQCIPLTPFCLGLTGDIDRINNAHNLAMVALTSRMGVCMAKTHLSLSDDPGRKGRPRDWRLSIGEILVYHGAELVVPVAGEIKLMPGTGSNPAFRRIDVEVETGKVTGLF